MNLALLAGLGVLEAVVWIWKMRSAVNAGRFENAASTFATCCTRLAFVYLGASAAMANEPFGVAVLAYALPATLATTTLPHTKKR